jgi:Cytochrome c biogenesis factor
MSVEHDFNMKIGEKKQLKDFQITLENLKVYDDKNFKKYIGDIVILNNKKNTIVRLKPEIRVYNSPETITYEASIKSKLFGDTYVTMSNISRSDFYNIKFQIKPFMNLIWFSTILIVLGGLLRMKDRKF